MWRKLEDREETVDLRAGLCLTIRAGTHFQFRSFGYEPLSGCCQTNSNQSQFNTAPSVRLEDRGAVKGRAEQKVISAEIAFV